MNKPLQVTLKWNNSAGGFNFVGGLIFEKTILTDDGEVTSPKIVKINRETRNMKYFTNGATGLSIDFEIDRDMSSVGEHKITMYYVMTGKDIDSRTNWKPLIPSGESISIMVSDQDISTDFTDVSSRAFEFSAPESTVTTVGDIYSYFFKIRGVNAFGENTIVSMIKKDYGFIIYNKSDGDKVMFIDPDGRVQWKVDNGNGTVVYKVEVDDVGTFLSDTLTITPGVGRVLKLDENNNPVFVEFPIGVENYSDFLIETVDVASNSISIQ